MSTLHLFRPTGALKEISITTSSAATALPTFDPSSTTVAVTSDVNAYGVFGDASATASATATGGFWLTAGVPRGFSITQDDTYIALKGTASGTVRVETGEGC